MIIDFVNKDNLEEIIGLVKAKMEITHGKIDADHLGEHQMAGFSWAMNMFENLLHGNKFHTETDNWKYSSVDLKLYSDFPDFLEEAVSQWPELYAQKRGRIAYGGTNETRSTWFRGIAMFHRDYRESFNTGIGRCIDIFLEELNFIEIVNVVYSENK